MMYAYTENPDYIRCLSTGTIIPPGHWMRADFDAWVAEGNTPAPYLPYEPYSVEHFTYIRTAAWAWMTSVVQDRRYDTIESCVSYANSGVARYKAEALAMIAWRDDINQTLEMLVVTRPPGLEAWEQVKPLLPQPEAYDWPAAVELPLDVVPPVTMSLE